MIIVTTEIICTIFDIIIWILFCETTMINHKKNIALPLYVIGFVFVDLVSLIPSYYFFLVYTYNKIFVLSFCSFCFTFLLSYYYDISFLHRIFSSITYIVICGLSEFLAGFLLQAYSVHFLHLTAEQFDMTTQLLSKFVQLIMIALIRVFWNQKQQHSTMQYSVVLLATPIISFLILLNCPYPIQADSIQIVSTLIIIIGIFIINIINYVLLDNVLFVKELKNREYYLQQQILFQENKYNQISTAYRNTRAILHETKRHFFYIQECAEKTDYDSIQAYLKKAIFDLENCFSRINTGNLVIDAFVSNHLSLAEQEHIQYETDINIVADIIPIDDYNLCILLGNLLDNSMQECRKIQSPHPRKITVEIFTTDTEFVLHVQNSAHIRKEKSEKEDIEYKLYHGYGLENVRKIVDNFNGTYLFTEEDNQCDSIIVIPIIK